MEQRDAAVAPGLRARATHALRQRHNWTQLGKFCAVGASGYAVNLAVYTALLNGADVDYRVAATGSFVDDSANLNEPVLTADELRALLQEQPSMPPAGGDES